MAAVALNLALNLAFMVPLQHIGPALATSVAAMRQRRGAGVLLRRRGHLRARRAAAAPRAAHGWRRRWRWPRRCWRCRRTVFADARRAAQWPALVGAGAAGRRRRGWPTAWPGRCWARSTCATRCGMLRAAALAPAPGLTDSARRGPIPRHEADPCSASSPASSRPASRRSATISARSATGWRCRTTTTASIAWWTCTRSPPGRTRRRCATQTREMAAALLACGIDPTRHILFLAIGGARACAAGLDLQLRRAAGLAEPDDAVQGQGRQGPRERRRPGCTSIRT